MKILEEVNLRSTYSLGYFFLGEIYADVGQKQKAFENLKKAAKLFQEMGMDYWLARARKVLESLQI